MNFYNWRIPLNRGKMSKLILMLIAGRNPMICFWLVLTDLGMTFKKIYQKTIIMKFDCLLFPDF